MVFHHTALYELLYLLVLFVLLTWLLHVRKERPSPGTSMGIFCLWYGLSRFSSDVLSVNDERVLVFTGPQYFCIGLVFTSAWVPLHVRKQLTGSIAAGVPMGLTGADTAKTGRAHVPTRVHKTHL